MIITWFDFGLRLAVATMAGCIVGLERSRQNRAIIGFRMLGLVALTSCIAILAVFQTGLPDTNADGAVSVFQGVFSGVKFIGVGALSAVGVQSSTTGSLRRRASGWLRLSERHPR